VSSAPAPDASPDVVRHDVRSWLAESWDPALSLLDWRRRLVEAGWAVPSWPTRWHGRGLPAWADAIVGEEMAAAGAVGLPVGVGMALAAPTILAHGPDAVRERFLRPILTGEETWCQLFSEPGAGSDLAGLSTRADLDGDRWVVNGQKVWSTSAHHADFGMLLARSSWDVPKHRGLTYFAIPMRQQGVEVRPLRQMNHHASFNEVFLADAVVPGDAVVGEVGAGWSVALTTLAHERRFGGMAMPGQRLHAGRALEEARRETDAHLETYKWYPQRAGRVDLAVEHAQMAGRAGDAVVRQELARLLAMHRVGGWTADRARTARALGRPPGAEGSIGKLALSLVAQQAARVHSLIGGASGLLTGPDGPLDGVLAEVLVSVPAQSIAGGTDEIQRNIIGEKVLGLPPEPRVDKDLPFREVRRS
jgi:alkylation response protein AidB-like acyl-CoA dehydrogenase